MNHKSMQVCCTLDEPMQLLMDKLASKSGDLYIFWVCMPSFSKTITNSTMHIMKKSQKFNDFIKKMTF